MRLASRSGSSRPRVHGEGPPNRRFRYTNNQNRTIWSRRSPMAKALTASAFDHAPTQDHRALLNWVIEFASARFLALRASSG
jgi:hypothetical protein